MASDNGHTKITCRFCDGKGVRDLADENVRTLKVVRELGKPTALEVHAALQEVVDITAVHNRLRRMGRFKLVRRVGKKPVRFEAVG